MLDGYSEGLPTTKIIQTPEKYFVLLLFCTSNKKRSPSEPADLLLVVLTAKLLAPG